MWRVYVRNHPTLGTWYTRVQKKPPWAIKIALVAAILTVVVPLVLLALAATVIGVTTFVVLGIVAWLINQVRAVFGAPRQWRTSQESDGRVNVRVVHHDR